MAILSVEDWERVKKLSPKTGVVNLNKPHALNRHMSIGVPVLSTINNLIYGGRD